MLIHTKHPGEFFMLNILIEIVINQNSSPKGASSEGHEYFLVSFENRWDKSYVNQLNQNNLIPKIINYHY